MRIERIELENWMSYPRRWVLPEGQSCDEEVVPGIDLSEDLTLIAGGNGAGKSAILEAICYALFAKYPRGNNQDAIRSNEETARIRLYFALPGGEGEITYCVERLLSRKAGRTNATLKLVQSDGSEQVLLTGQSTVTGYIKETLLRGVEYDAFVSTVFLRQEEAGRFMGLAHGEQREQLLRLCRLEIYERIYDHAKEHRRDLENQIDGFQKRFDEVKYATEEHLLGQRKRAQTLQVERDKLRAEEDNARKLLEKVRRTGMLAGEIEGREKRLLRWSDVLNRGEEIRHAEEWRIAWGRIEGSLTQGNKLCVRLSSRVGEIEQAEANLESSKEEVGRLKGEYIGLQADCQQCAGALGQVRDGLVPLIHGNKDARRALEATREAKQLDEEIAQIEEQQAKRRMQLVSLDEVRYKKDYNDLLKQAQNALRYVLTWLGDAKTQSMTAISKSAEAERARKESTAVVASIAETKRVLEELQKKEEDLLKNQNELQRQQDRARDIITNRSRAIEAGTCPTCGTEMRGEIGEHVCREIREREAQMALCDKQLQEIEQELVSVRSRKAGADVELATRENQARAFEDQAGLAETAASEARKSAARSRQKAKEQWRQHRALWQETPPPDWLETPSVGAQEEIQKELAELSGIDAEYHRLTRVQAAFQAEAGALQRDRQRRAALDVESPVANEQVARLQAACTESEEKLNSEQKKRDELAAKLKDLEGKREETKEELEVAQRNLSEIDRELNSLRTAQENDQQYIMDIRESLEKEQKRLESRFADLADELLPAIEHLDAFEILKKRAEQYAREARLRAELDQAEAESTKLQAEIRVKREEVEGLRKEIGSSSETEVSQQVSELKASVRSTELELNKVNREIGNTENDHERCQRLELQLTEAKRDHWAYKTIEDAVYPGTKTRSAGELFASITRELMESIGQEASRILEDLGWHIGISYDEKDGFCVEDRALSAVRGFNEFSGGERFAIAIAVALAIGRVTHGAGNIRCLFIDEGFGALDQGHRKQIIDDAIGRLIEIVSRDQVVVITNLRDMQAYFPNRVELKKEGECSALVPPTEEMLE